MSNVLIDVHAARAYVSRRVGTETSWTLEPAANWQQLESLAIEAVEAAGGGVTFSAIYACPPQLAARAMWAEDILDMVITTAEAAALHGKTRMTVNNAVSDGRVRGRKSVGTWLVWAADAEALWGNGDD